MGRICDGFDWWFQDLPDREDPVGPDCRRCEEAAAREWHGRWFCEEHLAGVRANPLYLAQVALTFAAEALREEAEFSLHYADDRSRKMFAEGDAAGLTRWEIEAAVRRAERARMEEARAADAGSGSYRREISKSRWTVRWRRAEAPP